uniref:Uncharacterized protein n=1 Tax=Nymphaea colorata TaxID=210225 RepID=A0A5K1GPL3_9MAGN
MDEFSQVRLTTPDSRLTFWVRTCARTRTRNASGAGTNWKHPGDRGTNHYLKRRSLLSTIATRCEWRAATKDILTGFSKDEVPQLMRMEGHL